MLTIAVLARHPQHVTVQYASLGTSHVLSFVYGSNFPSLRRLSWNNLVQINNNSTGNWLVIGDFNVVLGSHEKSGRSPAATCCSDIRYFIDNGGLFEVEAAGSFYTWNNGRHDSGRVECKLDRALVLASFLDY
ncbi:hypothetical protein M5689_003467 [Euphorbia peplus]|nr:hypothetical protein M5689_003467 [Euphorbia peplus]